MVHTRKLPKGNCLCPFEAHFSITYQQGQVWLSARPVSLWMVISAAFSFSPTLSHHSIVKLRPLWTISHNFLKLSYCHAMTISVAYSWQSMLCFSTSSPLLQIRHWAPLRTALHRAHPSVGFFHSSFYCFRVILLSFQLPIALLTGLSKMSAPLKYDAFSMHLKNWCNAALFYTLLKECWNDDIYYERSL